MTKEEMDKVSAVLRYEYDHDPIGKQILFDTIGELLYDVYKKAVEDLAHYEKTE
jgi:hypothetical protein